MKKKLMCAVLTVMTFCLLAGCSQPQTTASSAPAPAANSSAPTQEPDASAPEQTPDASASTPAAEPDASAPQQTSDASTAAQPTAQGKPMLSGAFLSQAQAMPSDQENIQTYQYNAATIVLGRFDTNHAAEAFLNESYEVGDFDVHEECTVAGTTGTHYRWKCGGNEDSSVVDAVVTSSGEYSLLFLVHNSQDAAEGMSDIGPTQTEVDGWIDSLTLAEQ